MKINGKRISSDLARQVLLFLFIGKNTYAEIEEWAKKHYPKVGLTVNDIMGIEDYGKDLTIRKKRLASWKRK